MLKSCEHGHDDMCVHFENINFRKVFKFAAMKGLQSTSVKKFLAMLHVIAQTSVGDNLK